MPRFLLSHAHEAADCGTAYASWRGFSSPLRHQKVAATCSVEAGGGTHRAFWTVEAESAQAALSQLPDWIAERSTATEVRDAGVP